jgi:hypothetical protein
VNIALFGDVHGDLELLTERVLTAAANGADAVIQLGDLGFRPDLLGPGTRWPKWPIPVLAIDGNHEDHAFLARARHTGLAAAWAAHGLVFQPRGSVVRLGTRRVGFLGGALHADRPQEVGNMISDAELSTALAAFAVRPPDLIATHSCPCRIGIGMRGADSMALLAAKHIVAAGYDAGPPNDCGEAALHRLWHSLTHKPPLWVFGHFHVNHHRKVANTQFLCVSDLGQLPQPPMWNTDTNLLTIA